MALFHFCYDLKFIVGVPLPWFAPPLQDIWRASISWVFIGLAGYMCALSRNNLKRAGVYGAVALTVFVTTSLVSVDAPINFGVIYCMAACTFVEWVLQQLHLTPKGPLVAAILFFVFLFLLPITHGYVGIGSLVTHLPASWYTTPYLSWLGLPGPGFVSGDYYPLLPYLLLFLAGASIGWWRKNTGFPDWLYRHGPRFLEVAGKHSLLIYVLHQPLLLLLCMALGWTV